MTPTATRLTRPWNTWVREVRNASGLSTKATAEFFSDLNFSAALLSLVECGKRHFSAAEYDRWREVFDVKVAYPRFPLANERELRHRETWNTKVRKGKKVKAVTATPATSVQVGTPWNVWVKEQRHKAKLTCREVLDLMGLPDAPATLLNDAERGKRKFKHSEYTAWKKALNITGVPVAIPLSQKVPYSIQRKIEASAPILAAPVQTELSVPQQALAASSRDSLLLQVQRVITNSRLTDTEVTVLVEEMREKAMSLLGI